MSGINESILAIGVYQKAADRTAHNIAGSGAIASKASSEFITSFDMDQYSGVESTTVKQLDVVGIPIPRSESTYFSIAGQGWALVKDSLDGNLGYCRDCTFRSDSSGYFVNNLNQYLQGFAVDENGIPIKSDVSSIKNLQPINVMNDVSNPEATTQLTNRLQLPASVAAGDPGSVYNQTITVYDSLGEIHSLNFEWTKVAGPYENYSATQAWNLIVTEPGFAGTVIDGSYATGSRIEFDGSGAPVAFDAQGENSQTSPNLSITWTNGANPSSINLNFGSVNSFNGVISVGDKVVNLPIYSNGNAPGTYISSSVDRDGFVVVNFSNTRSIKKFRIPLSNFPNVNGLKEKEPGFFSENSESGPASFNFPGENNVGFLTPHSIEGSTIDTTREYLDLIQTQMRYSANIKSIKTEEKLWEDLTTL